MNPMHALESALAQYLASTAISLVATTSIYKGTENPISVDNEGNPSEPIQKVHPSVTIEASGNHTEAVFNSGVFSGDVNITVEADGNQITDVQFRAICDDAFSWFQVENIESAISNSVSGFSVLQLRIVGHSHAIKSGENWLANLQLQAVYAEADL